jgi:hypothetical protein
VSGAGLGQIGPEELRGETREAKGLRAVLEALDVRSSPCWTRHAVASS